VIIPAFNAEDFIEETLASVNDQTYPNIEVIIVDDGSTDSTPVLVERFSASAQVAVQLVRQPNRGVSAARNHGASVARGEFLAFLDADDVWLPHKVSTQVEALRQATELIGVLCAYSIFDSSTGRMLSQVRFSESDSHFRKWLTLQGPGPLLPSTLVMTHSAWLDVGEFDEGLSTAADLDFGMRLRQFGKIQVLSEILVRYRISNNQMHRDPEALVRDYALITQKSYLTHDPSLVRDTKANLYLHLAYKRWLTERSAKRLVQVLAAGLLHPWHVVRRASRQLIRGQGPSVDKLSR